MNTTIMRLSRPAAVLLAVCSTAAIAQSQQPVSQFPNVALSTRLSAPSQIKNPVPVELTQQRELANEAVRLGVRQLELNRKMLKLLSQGNPVPSEMRQELDSLEVRQRGIADQQFSLSGRLFLKASEPGVFAPYITECLNRINQALSGGDTDLGRRFYGKTAWIQLDLTAGGKIESVIPQPLKQDDEFGVYLHDLIWKVPNFPEVPQLKNRKIERVSLSISFTLISGQP